MNGPTETSSSLSPSATESAPPVGVVLELPAAATAGLPPSLQELTGAALEAVVPTAISSARTRPTRFELKQQWEGTVVEIHQDSFVVTLKDLTNPSYPEESSELFLDDVGETDKPLLETGAIFYLSVGYEDTQRGRERKSVIRFRRLPGWSARSLEAARGKARELSNYFLDSAPEAQRR